MYTINPYFEQFWKMRYTKVNLLLFPLFSQNTRIRRNRSHIPPFFQRDNERPELNVNNVLCSEGHSKLRP